MFGLTPFSNRKSNELARRSEFGSLGSLFEDFFNDSLMPAFFSTGSNPIRADIRETEKEYVIEAEIPGVEKENIKLDLRDDVLTISVEHDTQVNEERDNYIRKERRFGSFSRSFYVENVKQDAVQAKYKDGILQITLPKEEGKKENKWKIDIQ